MVCLGTPIGSAEYVHAHGEKRMVKEKRLLAETSLMDDVQEAWALLLHYAIPRANHSIRTIPPSLVKTNAKAHGDAIWGIFLRANSRGRR